MPNFVTTSTTLSRGEYITATYPAEYLRTFKIRHSEHGRIALGVTDMNGVERSVRTYKILTLSPICGITHIHAQFIKEEV